MIDINIVLAEVDKNERVCLQPSRWNELWEMLPNKQRKGAGWDPSPPLILAAWWDSPILLKKLRMREHLVWAEKQKCLDTVYAFLLNMKEEDWYHGE